METLRGPVDAMSFRRGRRSIMAQRHGRALAHHADDVKGLQARDDRVRLREMVIERRHARPPVQYAPVRHRQRDVLVIIKNGHFELCMLRHDDSPKERQLAAFIVATWTGEIRPPGR